MKIETALKIRPNQEEMAKKEDARFRNASKLYEEHFIREMVKAMRKTVKPSGLVKQNFAEKIFREKLDEEYVQGWSNRGGVGLSDVIYSQLKERFSRHDRPQVISPKGPLPLDSSPKSQKLEKPDFMMLETPQSPESGQFLFQGPQSPSSVTSPWSGKVSKSFALESGQNVIEIRHDNGLNSKLVFNGSLNLNLQDKDLVPGESLGTMAGGGSTLSWRVTNKG